jgi:uncharacterized protein (TIGR00297 family)
MPPLPAPSQIWTALLFALAVAFLSHRLRALTFPVLVFFVSSHMLGLYRRQERFLAESLFAKTGSRDAWQVIANGGVAGTCAVGWFYFRWDGWYMATLGALAAATADTWATEIGVVAHSKPRLITNFTYVDAGTSGAVSLSGTLAALSGATVLGLGGLPWIPEGVRGETILAVSISGLAGSLVDSFLGATLQARFRCGVCGKISEKTVHCSAPAVRIGGLRIVSNDAVNLFCTISGAFFSLILLRFLLF